MKQLSVFFIILGLGLLNGCGGNKPEDVAETFVSSLSKADIQSAKDVSSEDTQKKIDSLIGLCNKSVNKQIFNEVLTILEALRNDPTDAAKKEELKQAAEELKGELPKLAESMKKNLEGKFGSPNNVPVEDREKVAMEMMGEAADSLKPHISKMMEILDIKTSYTDESTKAVSMFMLMGQDRVTYGNQETLKEMIASSNKGKIEAVTPECIAQYTDYDYVDSINILEVKQKSPDKAHVRLELIDKNEKSNKITVDVEKIKDEWKAASLPLDFW